MSWNLQRQLSIHSAFSHSQEKQRNQKFWHIEEKSQLWIPQERVLSEHQTYSAINKDKLILDSSHFGDLSFESSGVNLFLQIKEMD